jgi:adenylylsulfate kinase
MVGTILWLTGMPSSGKTTIALQLEDILKETGYAVELLDGDKIRTTICRGLGFSKVDRKENIRRIGFVARTLARHDVVVVVAAITPYEEMRYEQIALARAEDIPFILTYVQAELDTLKTRDVKGFYKEAVWGHVKNFTGVSDPFEEPLCANVVVNTDEETVEESTKKVLRAFAAFGLKE